MKLILLLSLPCLATAFTTSPSPQRSSLVLHSSRETAAATAIVAGLLTSQIASASPVVESFVMSPASTIVASTTVDQFTLPSYDSAKGVTVIDLKDEVQDVNKKTMANAKAKREYQDNSVEKTEFDKLRQIEADESKLFESMTKQSDADKKARIEMEKAESRANRWKTF